jgi:membrane protease YdiL (CAAX protease family)
VILSSVVFAATHFDVLSFPALVVFGAVMAVLVVRTGRLGAAVWAHVGFNATTIVLLLMDR